MNRTGLDRLAVALNRWFRMRGFGSGHLDEAASGEDGWSCLPPGSKNCPWWFRCCWAGLILIMLIG